MSNQNSIIAIARDTPYAAYSYNADNWTIVDSATKRWKTIGGSEGAFIYTQVDDENRLCLQSYSITDMENWNGSVLPTPPMSCIIAIASDADGIYTSFNGTDFSLPVVPYTVTKEIHLMAVAKSKAVCKWPYQIMLFAYVRTKSTYERQVSYLREFIATAHSVLSIIRRFLW